MEDLELNPQQIQKYKELLSGQPNGTIVKVSDAPEFCTMICFEKYIADGIAAVRKQIDQLDQVTIWRRATNAHVERFIK